MALEGVIGITEALLVCEVAFTMNPGVVPTDQVGLESLESMDVSFAKKKSILSNKGRLSNGMAPQFL
jgi:hypothetical protein